MSTILDNDWADLVESCSLDSWRQVLAGLLAHASADASLTAPLTQTLGARLEADQALLVAACLVFICAGNRDKVRSTVKTRNSAPAYKENELCIPFLIFTFSYLYFISFIPPSFFYCTEELALIFTITTFVSPPFLPHQVVDLLQKLCPLSSTSSLQSLIEKISLLSQATSSTTPSGSTMGVISDYAAILASQGELQLAFNYLNLVDNSENSAGLKWRLSVALKLAPSPR